MRRQKDMKSGTRTHRYSLYVYTSQLSFLSKCFSQVNTTGTITQDTAGIIVNNPDEGVERPYTSDTHGRKKWVGKKKKQDADADLSCVLKASLQRKYETEYIFVNDADRQFLLSLLPHMRKVPEYRKLATQMKILVIIYRYVGYVP
ncbi:hypothetical protein PR048_020066 [Dryococelus australis]|uniref:BESS domain-containing protein n=1 Tax=Dryococelus australis TaxID=614101 RepID=A0ABQ9H5M1_9NEOP|nr:hypothetical protein PR048_020066 [Dryococelus australis]